MNKGSEAYSVKASEFNTEGMKENKSVKGEFRPQFGLNTNIQSMILMKKK